MKRFLGVLVLIVPLLTNLRVSAQLLESIDRGTIALMKESGKTFISWRSLESDPIEGTCFTDSTIHNGVGYPKILSVFSKRRAIIGPEYGHTVSQTGMVGC